MLFAVNCVVQKGQISNGTSIEDGLGFKRYTSCIREFPSGGYWADKIAATKHTSFAQVVAMLRDLAGRFDEAEAMVCNKYSKKAWEQLVSEIYSAGSAKPFSNFFKTAQVAPAPIDSKPL